MMQHVEFRVVIQGFIMSPVDTWFKKQRASHTSPIDAGITVGTLW